MTNPNSRWKRRARVVAIPLAIMAGAGGYLALTHGANSIVEPEQGDLARFDWPKDNVYSYSLDWKVEQKSRLLSPQKDGSTAAKQVDGGLDIKGSFELRSYGRVGDVFMLGLSVSKLERATWTILGQDVLKGQSGDRLLQGHEAFLEVTPNGRVVKTHFLPHAPAELKSLFQGLSAELQVVLPTEAIDWKHGKWMEEEETPLGRAQAEYQRAAGSAPAISRSRPYYLELRGGNVDVIDQSGRDVATATLAKEGHLERLSSASDLKLRDANGPLLAYEKKTEVRLLGVRRDKARALPDLKAKYATFSAGESPAEASSEREALVNRVGKLSTEQMVSDVLSFANGGRMDHEWMWQATGLLELHPEATSELEAAFAHPELTSRGKGLVLDLLASAGTDEAQRSLRKLVDLDTQDQTEEDHAVLYNRMSLLSSANRETAEFVAKKFEQHAQEEVGPMRIASTYAVGAIANRQAAQGDMSSAQALNQKLKDGLAQASTDEEKEVALRGMGNAGLEENTETLVKHTKDPSTDVRAAAADALRKNHNDRSVTALIELLRDPEWKVQQSALNSLTYYTLSVPENQRIESFVVAGVVSPQNDPLLVSVLAKGATPEHPFAEGFGHILQRNQENGQLAARIRAIARRNGVTL